MYERFYGLIEHPFSLTPDPEFIFISQNFREALDQITNAVKKREPLTVLTGDVGTGKTTLCWALLLRMQKDARTALILNPLLGADDLLKAIIQDFNVKFSTRRAPWKIQIAGMAGESPETARLQRFSRKQLMDELNRSLLEGAGAGITSVLVIDEAQDLPIECLELLHLLSSLEAAKREQLQIILSGQLELDRKLNLPTLRPLTQSIRTRCLLQPLSKDDMIRYIYHRIWKAGGDRRLSFSKGSLNAIYRHSQGYPRLINLISDRALMAGCKDRSWGITGKMVRTAAAQLGMSASKKSRLAPFFTVRRILTVTALMILAGIIYFVRPYRMLINLADHLRTKDSVPASFEKTDSAKSLPLTQPTAHRSSPQPDPSPSNGPIAGFSLQVHSMQTPQQAAQALAELRQKGYPVFQRVIRNDDQSLWYVVYVGPFADSAKAQQAAAMLLHREEIHAIWREFR